MHPPAGECVNAGEVSEAALWSPTASPTWLGVLPGGTESRAFDMGSAFSGAAAASGDGGMRSLFDVRVANGVEGLDGWRLVDAVGISDDGTRIVGNGYSPDGDLQGFIVELTPVPIPGAALPLASALGALVFRRPEARPPAHA